MPYYVVPQIVEEHRDDHGVLIDTTTRPDLPGGVGWRGDTDGVSYLVFVDRELPPGGRYMEAGVRSLRPLIAEINVRRAETGRPLLRVADVDRWRLGKEQPIPEPHPGPGPAPVGGP